MFLDQISEFFIKSISNFPEERIMDKVKSISIFEGLKSIPDLLRQIYNDYPSYESIDYPTSYHNLMNTIKFLFYSMKWGSQLMSS